MSRVVLLLTCEHGGHEIPPAYRPLFAGAGDVLVSHRGYDPGALGLARAAAKRMGAPLRSATVSRLLVDLNRSPTHPSVFSPYTRALPHSERQMLLERWHQPHHRRVEQSVAEGLARGHALLHVAVHSFTPVWEGRPRPIDFGLLYDSRRPAERHLASLWKAHLQALDPDLRLRRNAPYRGSADGLTTILRRRFRGSPYMGFELELNYAHVTQGRFSNRLRYAAFATIEVLRDACASMSLRRLVSKD